MKWQAEDYTKNFDFVHIYGEDLLKGIDAREGLKVLDLGCGNGALTHVMATRGWDVVGLDASQELLAVAVKNYPDIPFIYGDATEFRLKKPVDVVFSNAVLHWIDQTKQRDVLNCVDKALRKNGQFVFEFGGYGNNAVIHHVLAEAFAQRGYDYHTGFYFPTIGTYATLLETAGFHVPWMHLFPRMTTLKGEDGLRDWIHMFVQRPFEVVPESDREVIVRAVVTALRETLYFDGAWHADYVRIRGKAIKK